MNTKLDPFEKGISEQAERAIKQIVGSIAMSIENIASPLRMIESGDDFDSTSRLVPFPEIILPILSAILEKGVPEFIQNYTYSANLRDYLVRELGVILAPGNPAVLTVEDTEIIVEKYIGIIRIALSRRGSTEEHFYEYSPTNLAMVFNKLKKTKFGAGGTGEARHTGPGNQK